uniref:Prolamin-like domain-containing protein n=1 Tax=Salix viminalis TaxID=40686 RepID=A0A6N2M2R5_SALVM
MSTKARNPATSDSRPAQNPSTPDSRPSFDSRFAADSRPSFDSRLASDSGAAFTSYPWTAVTSRSAPGTGSASTTPCPRPVFTSTTPNSRRSSCRTSSGHNQCWTAVANAAGCVVDITPLLHRQLSTVGPACCKALIQ